MTTVFERLRLSNWPTMPTYRELLERHEALDVSTNYRPEISRIDENPYLKFDQHIFEYFGVNPIICELCLLKSEHSSSDPREGSAVSYILGYKQKKSDINQVISTWCESLINTVSSTADNKKRPVTIRESLYNMASPLVIMSHDKLISKKRKDWKCNLPHSEVFFSWNYRKNQKDNEKASELAAEFASKFVQESQLSSKNMFLLYVPVLRADMPAVVPTKSGKQDAQSWLRPGGALLFFGSIEVEADSRDCLVQKVKTQLNLFANQLRGQLLDTMVRDAPKLVTKFYERMAIENDLGHIMAANLAATGWTKSRTMLARKVITDSQIDIPEVSSALKTLDSLNFVAGVAEMLRVRGIIARGDASSKLRHWLDDTHVKDNPAISCYSDKMIKAIKAVLFYLQPLFEEYDATLKVYVFRGGAKSEETLFSEVGDEPLLSRQEIPPFKIGETGPINILASALIEPIKNALKYLRNSFPNDRNRNQVTVLVRSENSNAVDTFPFTIIEIHNCLQDGFSPSIPSGLRLVRDALREIGFGEIQFNIVEKPNKVAIVVIKLHPYDLQRIILNGELSIHD